MLAGEVPATAIAGRLVLLGLTAESGEPLFQTPYSNRLAGTPPRLAGVTIQANTIAALMAGALQGRPPGVQALPEFLEWLWGSGGAALG